MIMTVFWNWFRGIHTAKCKTQMTAIYRHWNQTKYISYILSTQISPASWMMSCYCPLLHPCISIYTLLPLLVIVALVLEFLARGYRTKYTKKNLTCAPACLFCSSLPQSQCKNAFFVFFACLRAYVRQPNINALCIDYPTNPRTIP